MHYACVGGIERNERNQSLRNIGKLARAFGITAADLLNVGNGPKERQEAEATLFAILRGFETKELRFVGLLLKLLMRWNRAVSIRS